jgi:hypothetical protein
MHWSTRPLLRRIATNRTSAEENELLNDLLLCGQSSTVPMNPAQSTPMVYLVVAAHDGVEIQYPSSELAPEGRPT